MTAQKSKAAGRGTEKKFAVRLGISCFLLVLAVALWLVLGLLKVYQRKLENESRRVSTLLVRNLSAALQSEGTEPVRTVSLDITTRFVSSVPDFFGLFDTVQGNAVKLLQTYRFLCDERDRYAGTVSGIRVYYPEKGIEISDRQGLLLAPDYKGWTLQQCASVVTTDALQQECWLGSYNSALYGESLTLYRFFPYPDRPQSAKAVVAVDLNVQHLYEILKQFASVENSGIWILDSLGRPVTGWTGRELAVKDASGWLHRAGIREGNTMGPHTSDVPYDSERYQVYLNTVETGGLYVLEVMPLAHILKQSEEARWQVLLLFLFVLAAGSAASVVLAWFANRPVGRLYVILDKYRPLVFQDLAERLLSGARQQDDFLKETAERAGFDFSDRSWRAFCLHWNYVKTIHSSDTPPERYLLVQSLAEWFGDEMLPAFRGDFVIAGIVRSGPDGNTEFVRRFENWITEEERLFPVRIYAGAGCVSDVPSGFRESYVQAEQLAGWSWFAGEQRVLLCEPQWLTAPGRGETDRLASGWTAYLSGRDAAGLQAAVSELRELLAGGKWQKEYRRAFIEKICGQTRLWMEQLQLPEIAIIVNSLPVPEKCTDVLQFLELLSESCTAAFALLENNRENRQSAVVARVREYVRSHLSGNLSLEKTAAAAGFSTSYLSHLFKTISDSSYISFVTECRVTEAARLLETTNLTVSTISSRTGFSTPAYFIRQFKRTYGMSPREYRLARNGSAAPGTM
jgi:two-component system, response regulator YesN